MSTARAVRLLTPVADALDTAHAAGLTHRDIKPQNILVGAGDHPYLADFGLTRSATDAGLTRTGQFVGTIDYVSPEQIRGEQATAASDIYALTAVLYESLCGVVPYPQPSDHAVLFSHLSDPPPRVTDRRPELPAELDDVVARGLAKDPGERQTSGSELVEQAERAITTGERPVTTRIAAPATAAGSAAARPAARRGRAVGGSPSPSRPRRRSARPSRSPSSRAGTAAVVASPIPIPVRPSGAGIPSRCVRSPAARWWPTRCSWTTENRLPRCSWR